MNTPHEPHDVVYDDGVQRLTVADVAGGFDRMARAAVAAGAAMCELGEAIRAVDAVGMSPDEARRLFDWNPEPMFGLRVAGEPRAPRRTRERGESWR